MSVSEINISIGQFCVCATVVRTWFEIFRLL